MAMAGAAGVRATEVFVCGGLALECCIYFTNENSGSLRTNAVESAG